MLRKKIIKKILSSGNFKKTNSRFYIVYFLSLILLIVGHFSFGIHQALIKIDSLLIYYNLIMGVVHCFVLILHLRGIILPVVILFTIDLLVCAWWGMDFYGPKSASYLYVIMSALTALAPPVKHIRYKVMYSLFCFIALFLLLNKYPFDTIYPAQISHIEMNFMSNVATMLLVIVIFVLVYVTAADEAEDKLLVEYEKVRHQKNIIESNNTMMEDQLELAKQIQKNFIPRVPPRVKGLKISAFYKPMHQVGGDYYDFIKDDENLGIIISDVTGHGLSAAFITSMIKTLVDSSDMYITKPTTILKHINNKIMNIASGYYLTAFYTSINLKTKEMTYARGGHDYPLLIRKGHIIELKSRGILLGVEKNFPFETKTIQLEKNDKIFFFTDGLTETRNNSGVEFNSQLKSLLINSAHLSINKFIDEIYNELLLFNKTKIFEDDICMIALEVS